MTDYPNVLYACWEADQREMQYIGLDLMRRFSKKVDSNFIDEYAYYLVTKSWWDTVDSIIKPVATYFQRFPELQGKTIEKWMASDNIWLQRACLLFQLPTKVETNEALLFDLILRLKDSDEFFIQKAIGWALREHSKSQHENVVSFVEEHNLAALSKREALKWLKTRGKI